MASEKKRVVTSRERGRIQALIMGIASIAMIVFGIYLVTALSNWIVLALAAVFTVCAVIFYFNNEKVHRNGP